MKCGAAREFFLPGNVAGRTLPPAVSGGSRQVLGLRIAGHVRGQKLLAPKVRVVARDHRLNLLVARADDRMSAARADELKVQRPLDAAGERVCPRDAKGLRVRQRVGCPVLQRGFARQAEAESLLTRRQREESCRRGQDSCWQGSSAV